MSKAGPRFPVPAAETWYMICNNSEEWRFDMPASGRGARVRVSACLLCCMCWSVGAQPAPAQTSSQRDEEFLAVYQKAQPITNWPLKKLLHAFPELKGLRRDESQASLSALLSGVAKNLEIFRKEFPNLASLETIDESRVPDTYTADTLALSGVAPVQSPPRDTDREKFRYLMLAGPSNGGLTEYRTDLHGHEEHATPQTIFVKTIGFVTLPFFFAADSQRLSDFRYLGSQTVVDHPCQVVAFAEHVEPQAVRGRLTVGMYAIPLIMQGIAWIDPALNQIVRIRADLLAPQPGAHFTQLTTVALFEPVKFQSRPTTLWLPKEVHVTLDSQDYTYENHHRYADYQLFNVETQQTVEAPKPDNPE